MTDQEQIYQEQAYHKQTFELKGSYIELYKLIKLFALASSGGEAKHFIDQGLVKVNGKVETRKRRKLLANDEVVFAQNRIAVSNSEVNAQIHGDSEMVGRN